MLRLSRRSETRCSDSLYPATFDFRSQEMLSFRPQRAIARAAVEMTMFVGCGKVALHASGNLRIWVQVYGLAQPRRWQPARWSSTMPIACISA